MCLSETSKTILQGTVKEGRSQGRQKKGWEDNMREWTGQEFAKSQRAVEIRLKKKEEETGSEVICGAPTTLAVQELVKVKRRLQSVYVKRSVVL